MTVNDVLMDYTNISDEVYIYPSGCGECYLYIPSGIISDKDIPRFNKVKNHPVHNVFRTDNIVSIFYL